MGFGSLSGSITESLNVRAIDLWRSVSPSKVALHEAVLLLQRRYCEVEDRKGLLRLTYASSDNLSNENPDPDKHEAENGLEKRDGSHAEPC